MLKVTRFVDQSDEGAVTIEVQTDKYSSVQINVEPSLGFEALTQDDLGIDSEADFDALCELRDGIEAYVRARQEA
ncbi:hypothetical protein [uncultured Bifidobacterium sp.]|uniref:hypothetical protein n=1 Tax=uncultured Bifidobacterium sp. TaxID=165187 RepID=UPI0025925B4C|nr:hypothetical protein [uncultured Bifidobacterium sp.]